MGGGRSETIKETTGSSTPELSPEQRRLLNLQTDEFEATSGGRVGIQQQGLETGRRLLGGEDLPGFLGALPGGITPQDIEGSTQTGLNALNVALAKSGAGTFVESGVAQESGITFAAEQELNRKIFNLQNLSQLLNIATGTQALPVSAGLETGRQLGAQLSGLTRQNVSSRTLNQGPTFGQQFTGAFAGAAGKTLGSPSFGVGPFKF